MEEENSIQRRGLRLTLARDCGLWRTFSLVLLLLLSARRATASSTNDVAQGASSSSSPVVAYFANWFARVAATQAEQPHWAPPVATTSPTLTEVLRYDMMWKNLPNSHTLSIFGSGKGVELIPAERVELNYTYWPSCAHKELNQLFVTPGLVLGKLPIWRRLGAMVGVGYQIALTDKPIYRQNLILTARLPF